MFTIRLHGPSILLSTSRGQSVISKDFYSIRRWPQRPLFWGSAVANGREPTSCLGRVFNFKLGSFVSKRCNCMACTRPLLGLKTQTRFRRISWSLSMAGFNQNLRRFNQQRSVKVRPGNPWWSGKLSTVDLLVLTILDQMFFLIFFHFLKTHYLKEEVNGTSFPLVSVPWFDLS